MTAQTGRGLAQFPVCALRPEGRQFLPGKPGPDAAERIVPGDAVAADERQQPDSDSRPPRALRFARHQEPRAPGGQRKESAQ